VPEDDQVLVKVHATTINRTDVGVRSPRLLYRLPMRLLGVGGLVRPLHRVLGSEFSGEIAAVGASVEEFGVGERVFGVNAGGFGAHAEYLCMKESAPLARMPVGMAFEDAAAICDGAILALECLRLADLRAGQSILVYGASGSIGTAGVQLARHLGARVTAVCNSKNLELVKSLGADHVIDYAVDDFTTGSDRYDVILDAWGKLSYLHCRGSLERGGTYLATDRMLNFAFVLATRWLGDKKVRFLTSPRYRKEDVRYLKGLIEGGSYRAVVDRTYSLADAVEASRYVATEQKTGNVVLCVISS
jgi:NADPH:quinone reductase-like Zn-dependent oxidoreductase